MKIRTRLLLFLLPTVICSIALVSTLLSYNWYQEIVEGFRTRLKTASLTAATIQLTNEQLNDIKDRLQVTGLHFVPISSSEIETIPKDLHITPIYKSNSGEKLITGYAPVFDSQGHISGLMAADINVSLIDNKFQESLYLIILCAGFTILVVVATLFLIANKISKPVARLNNSALAIAAGKYGESIPIRGPKEIAELANTLNTMSECLYENINRLKENSFLRERMYGEYECALLLQHMMLQKNIDDCRSDAVAVKPITFFSEEPRGLLLDFPKQLNSNKFLIHMAEADEVGFQGMYQLLTQYKLSQQGAAVEIGSILGQEARNTTLELDSTSLKVKGPHLPIIWSLNQETFTQSKKGLFEVESGDYLFLFNDSLIRSLKGEKPLKELLSKVLKVFASDGLETTSTMLQKELHYLTKRKELEEDIHLLPFQLLNL